jgi:transposase-like protein
VGAPGSGRPHAPEIKARAVALLATGKPASQVASEMGIPVATIRTWRQQLRRDNIIGDPRKKDDLGELVFGYLHEAITTLSAQARFARDEDWLRQQNASDLAILHGVLHDKTVRLLAALQPANDTE